MLTIVGQCFKIDRTGREDTLRRSRQDQANHASYVCTDFIEARVKEIDDVYIDFQEGLERCQLRSIAPPQIDRGFFVPVKAPTLPRSISESASRNLKPTTKIASKVGPSKPLTTIGLSIHHEMSSSFLQTFLDITRLWMTDHLRQHHHV